MRIQIRLLAAAAVVVLLVAVPTAANAGTFTNSYNGSEATTRLTTLRYSSGHKAFNLRIWVASPLIPQFGADTRYGIRFYDSQGRQVWSASNQKARTYYVGSNVTRLEVRPNQPGLGAFGYRTRWERK